MATTAAATKVSIRKDPAPRQVDAEGSMMRLKNEDPNYIYKAAYMGSHGVNGVGYYEMLGYEKCLTPNPGDNRALRFAFGLGDGKPGEPMQMMGHIIMRMAKAKYEELDLHGGHGQGIGGGGQSGADAIENAIIRQRETADAIRGVNSRYGEELYRLKNMVRPAMSIQKDAAAGDVRLEDNE